MKIRYIILGLAILLFALYNVLFNYAKTDVSALEVMPFDKSGFVEAETLSDPSKLVSSNERFNLYLDETTSYFTLEDTVSGELWQSNPTTPDPWETDPTKTITNSALNKQRSTIELTYFNQSGSVSNINNYKYSIYHPQTILDPAGLRTFAIKYTDTGFQVLYTIEDLEIDYLYFPKYLEKDVLENLENRNILEAIAYTGYDDELEVYEIVQYESMSRLVKQRLYDTFYGEDGLGYTREQAIDENQQYGYTETFEKVRFEIGVDVSLTDEGIQVTVLHDSIVEPGNVKLANVKLYPLFGTAVKSIAGDEQEGYIVLPDGSGAVMEFNNGKFYQEPYIKRLYGNDLALLPHKMPEDQELIHIPLYGMVKENGGYAAIITKGDTMATIHADVSERIDSYNKVYTAFALREHESITLGSGFNQYGLDLWTEEKVHSDFQIQYTFFDQANASYVEMANVYRDYLLDQGMNAIDTTPNPVVTTELIGAYDRKKFFLGVPYRSLDSMTTFDQAEIILDALKDRGLDDLVVVYRGIINGGLSTSVNDRFNIERTLGGKRGYDEFLDYIDEQNLTFAPKVSLLTASEYNKMFDRFRYTANRIDGSQSVLFNYHLPSKLPYSETPYEGGKQDYVLSPLYYESIWEQFNKRYDQNNIAFEYMGSNLLGHYNDNEQLYKQDTLELQRNMLMEMEKNIILTAPLGFSLPYASYITDVPTGMTLYAILDYPIPLLQLVLSGQLDYATVSLNLQNERSIEYNFLKIIETASNVKYTLSFDDSKELKETEYNYYLSTQYTNWLDIMESTVNELHSIGIYSGHLVSHERLASNVVSVEYSHGLEVILNYNLSSVVVNGVTIAGLDYHIVEVD